MAVENTEDYIGSLEIEKLMPIPYFTLLYIAALSQLLRAVQSRKGGEGHTSKFPTFVEGKRIQWPTDLVSYFEPDEPDFKDLKVSAKLEIRQELSTFLHNVSNAFLDDMRAYLKDVSGDDLGPLSHVQRFMEEAQGKAVNELIVSKKAPTYFAVLNDGDADQSRANVVRKVTDFAKLAVKYLSEKLGGDRITSADVPGVDITDETLLKTRFMGWSPSPAHLHDSGLYFVIRQARGHLTQDPKREGIVVRDLLWIRPGITSFENGVRGTYETYGSRLGYYFSAIDEQVFEITFIVKRRDGVMMIDAIAYLDDRETKSLCLYLPSVDNGNGFSLGSMVGIVETKPIPPRTGSWTVVAMRAEIDQGERDHLEGDLAVVSDAMAELSNRDDYDERIIHSVRLMESRHLIGVLFSKSWLESATAEERRRLEKRDEAFSRMFRNWSIYDAPDNRVDVLVAEINLGSDDAEIRLRRILKELVEDEERHALTPPAVQRQSDDRSALEADIETLSSRDDVLAYATFMDSKPAKMITPSN